jgi:AcrR family transcriptional regulator
MSEIAAASGLTRTTIYRHFPSREHLARALFDQVLTEANARVAGILAEALEPEALLRRVATMTVELGDRYRFLDGHPELIAEQRRAAATPDEPLRLWAAGAAAAGRLRAGVTPGWLVGAVGALAQAAFEEVRAGRASLAEAGDQLGDTLVAAFLA